jgi:hypothetical protein
MVFRARRLGEAAWLGLSRGLVPWALAASALAGLGCESADVKLCRSQYLQAYAEVAAVDTAELDSVEKALLLVNSTYEVCQRAGLAEEKKQLTVARNKLESHQAYLQRQATQKKLTPDELAKLVKQGDPYCPKGQSYTYQKAGGKVKCTGAQIADMNWKQANEYFSQRGFKLTRDGGKFKAESGSESYNYTFTGPDDAGPAKCLVVFAPAGIAWEETAARITGERPSRLKRNEPIKTARGAVPLAVEEDAVQAILRLGDCDS